MPHPPLILHIGLHKTATSWLQAHILDNSPESAFWALKDYRAIISELLVPDEMDFDAARARQAFVPFLDEAWSQGKIAVITSEALGGLPFHKRFHRTAFAYRLAETFPEAKILVTIREQAAVILSIYGQFVRFGYFSSLRDFLLEPPPETGYQSILEYPYYDYDNLYDLYGRLFGHDNVVMAPYELITKTPQWLTDYIGDMTSCAIQPPDIQLGAKKVNTADSAQARWVTRHLNRFISREHRWKPRKDLINPNGIGAKIDKLIPSEWAKKAKQRDLHTVRAAIGERYDESNAHLAERLGVNLGALGYRV